MLRDGKGNVDSVRLQLNVFFGRPIDSGDDCALAAGRNGVGLNVLNRKRVSWTLMLWLLLAVPSSVSCKLDEWLRFTVSAFILEVRFVANVATVVLTAVATAIIIRCDIIAFINIRCRHTVLLIRRSLYSCNPHCRSRRLLYSNQARRSWGRQRGVWQLLAWVADFLGLVGFLRNGLILIFAYIVIAPSPNCCTLVIHLHTSWKGLCSFIAINRSSILSWHFFPDKTRFWYFNCFGWHSIKLEIRHRQRIFEKVSKSDFGIKFHLANKVCFHSEEREYYRYSSLHTRGRGCVKFGLWPPFRPLANFVILITADGYAVRCWVALIMLTEDAEPRRSKGVEWEGVKRPATTSGTSWKFEDFNFYFH